MSELDMPNSSAPQAVSQNDEVAAELEQATAAEKQRWIRLDVHSIDICLRVIEIGFKAWEAWF